MSEPCTNLCKTLDAEQGDVGTPCKEQFSPCTPQILWIPDRIDPLRRNREALTEAVTDV